VKVRLLHRDRDVDLEQPLVPNADALTQDLGIQALLDAAADGDDYLRNLARHALLTGLETVDEITYRLDILSDFLAQPGLARQLYDLAVEGVEARRNARFFWLRDTPDTQVKKSLAMLQLLMDVLKRLRTAADVHAGPARSEGLGRLFAMLHEELDDSYLAVLDEYLQELQFKDGALISAKLGGGNRGRGYVLRRRSSRGLLDRLTPDALRGMSFSVSPRDEYGMRALGELRDRGLALVGNALAQSTDHILAFLGILRDEVGFYVACLNLRQALAARGVPTVLPEPVPPEERALSLRGLVDPALALHLEAGVVGNGVDADGKHLVVVTGANEGGKSTFLRSLGTAQLMLEAGMFVAADSYRASISSGVFTHFKREEDVSMRSGKLDEELRRMSEIADWIRPHGLLLCNESFASTNEAEGSEIGRQVVCALVEDNVRVAYVTHMFELSRRLQTEESRNALFLRAERKPDGSRTFRMVPGEPEPTSYGADSYRRIFGRPPQPETEPIEKELAEQAPRGS
jgi:DNA mismatch repair ATPase MutS